MPNYIFKNKIIEHLSPPAQECPQNPDSSSLIYNPTGPNWCQWNVINSLLPTTIVMGKTYPILSNPQFSITPYFSDGNLGNNQNILQPNANNSNYNWSSSGTYFLGSIIKFTDQNTYMCVAWYEGIGKVTANNRGIEYSGVNTSPLTDSNAWIKVYISSVNNIYSSFPNSSPYGTLIGLSYQKLSPTTVSQYQLLNSFDQFNTSSTNTILNNLSSVTKGKDKSVVVAVPSTIASIFTNNSVTYPKLVGSKLPVTIASTRTDTISGNENLEVTQVFANTILVVPSLITGSTIDIGGTKIKRGNDTNSNLLYINGSNIGNELGSLIKIGNNSYQLAGIGSPVVFIISSSLPETVFDYLFMFSYFFAFVGAILFSVTSIISVDVTTIIANKNISTLLNVYIGITGLISLYVWYGINLPINVFNQNVVVVGNVGNVRK